MYSMFKAVTELLASQHGQIVVACDTVPMFPQDVPPQGVVTRRWNWLAMVDLKGNGSQGDGYLGVPYNLQTYQRKFMLGICRRSH